MCGFAGFLDLTRGQPASALTRTVAAMAATLNRRGPDDSGEWVDERGGIALGHRRLAVIDLSDAGAQPMESADGRFVIAYNGEIYNAREIAARLAAEPGARPLRGHCDTEVLLEAAARWGVTAAVESAVGMFAFALWDKRERRLTLARDRLGIKPLYWGRMGRLVLFGSELKALSVHPSFRAELDTGALAAYMRHGYVPAPNTIYRDISKLPPGHILEIDMDDSERLSCYWDLRTIAAESAAAPRPISDPAAIDELEDLLGTAVRDRMISDVPLGAFLSGGIDSSTVVALMQAAAGRPVKSFTIGFDEAGYNEAEHARAVAGHLGTDHTELTVRADDARAVIPELPDMHDEPFADASAIPTFLVSRLARSDVTVALSGDGGDELFAGYDRYRVAGAARMAFVPAPLRRALGRGLGAIRPAVLDSIFRPIPAAGDKLAKLARVLRAGGDDDVYRAVISLWDRPEILVPGAVEAADAAGDSALAHEIPQFLARMQYLDTTGYLPDNILTKVDRASMAVSLEARVPMLDHRVVEFAWRLPTQLKRRRGVSKWVLRQVLGHHLPKTLFERPKMGFGVPVGDWLRGPLKPWAESLLEPGRVQREGVLDARLITRHWDEHQRGARNWSYRLWTVLMFQAWRERWLP
jgi:asparagine synthase (glutamine-hydrolysing)